MNLKFKKLTSILLIIVFIFSAYNITSYSESSTINYYVLYGGTGDGSSREKPAPTVNAVMATIAASSLTVDDTAVINILENGDWNSAPQNNLHKMTSFESITASVSPKIIIQGDPEANEKVHLAYNSNLTNRHISVATPVTFKNLIFVATPNGQESYIYTLCNDVYFDSTVEYCYANPNWTGGKLPFGGGPNIWLTQWIDSKTYDNASTYTIKSDSVSGGKIYLPGNNYNNSTHTKDVNLILDNSNIGSDGAFSVCFGPGGTGSASWGALTATFKKNVNINVKNAAAVNFTTGAYPHHQIVVDGGIQLILNDSVNYNTTDIANISTVALPTTNKVYVLKNSTGNADIIDFTANAGTFKVANGKTVSATDVNGNVIYSEDGLLTVTPGEWTIEYTSFNVFEYYVLSGATGDGRSDASPAPSVVAAINTINADNLPLDAIANIYIMQKSDWNTAPDSSGTHNMTYWANAGEVVPAHSVKISVQSYDKENKSNLAYYSAIGTGDITLGGPTEFKNINIVATNTIYSSIYADGNNLTFESSVGFYRVNGEWTGGELTNAWNPNVSLTKYISSGSYNNAQTVIYKTTSISDGALSIPGRCYNAASHNENINIVLDNTEIGRVNDFQIKFAGNHEQAITTNFKKGINIEVKNASKVALISGANANASQKLNVEGGVQVLTGESTKFSSKLDDLNVFTDNTDKWFITLDGYAFGKVKFTENAGVYTVNEGVSVMAVNEDGDIVVNEGTQLTLRPGNWTISKSTLPQPDKMLFFNSIDGSPFMQRFSAEPNATYNLTFSLADSISDVKVVSYTNGNRAEIKIDPQLISKIDQGKYTTYTYSFTMPSDFVAGLAFVGFKFPTGIDGYIFDINLYKADDVDKTALFPNSDFKVGLNNWAYGWKAWFGVTGNADLYSWKSEFAELRVENFSLGAITEVLPERMLYIKETKVNGDNILVQKLMSLKSDTEYTASFNYNFLSGAINKTLNFTLFTKDSSGNYSKLLSSKGEPSFATVTDKGNSISYTFTLSQDIIADNKDLFIGFDFGSEPDMITEFYVHDLKVYESAKEVQFNMLLDDKFSDTIENWYSLNGSSQNGYEVFSRSDTEFTAQYMKYNADYFGGKTSEIHYGDSNADGVIDIRDLVNAKKLSSKSIYFPLTDINKDNSVNAPDLLLIKRHLLGVEAIAEWSYHIMSVSEANICYGGADSDANNLKEEIKSAPDTVKAAKTTYYISESGKASNDGITSNSPTTIEKLNDLPLTSGDAVLFKRGDTFRISNSISLVSGVNYGAYGEGEKPIISGSIKNYTDKKLWSSNDGNIWKLNVASDIGHIFFDNDKYIGVRKASVEALNTDGDYYEDNENKILYLYLTQRNPASYFESIEIPTTKNLFVSDAKENINIQNIVFKYSANDAIILTGAKNIGITGCEFLCIGGAQSGDTSNAITFKANAQTCSISKNRFYNIFDSAIALSGTANNIEVKENLIEYCSTGLKAIGGKNVVFDNNILRFAGYGFSGTTRNDAENQAFIDTDSEIQDLQITNNTFDSARAHFFSTTNASINFSGNNYYQQKGNILPEIKSTSTYSNNKQTFENAIKLVDNSPRTVVWLNETDIALKSIKKIARIGWRVYEGGTPPEQSLASFRAAYEQGFRILLCDVRFTADGHIVCLHDDTINSVARNKDGSALTENVYINDLTLAEANQYDFGIKKGSQYKGTTILRLEEFIALCEELGCTPHLELKEDPTEEQADYIVSLLKKHGFEKNVMFNGGSVKVMQYISKKLPEAILGRWVGNITDELIAEIASYGTTNKKFIYVSNGFHQSITEENYQKCLERGLDIGYTEIRSRDELAEILDSGILNYCTYVATRYFDLT